MEEVKAYCQQRQNGIDPQHFVDHYTANGWKVGGRTPMRDWQAAVRTWEQRDGGRRGTAVTAATGKYSAVGEKHEL